MLDASNIDLLKDNYNEIKKNINNMLLDVEDKIYNVIEKNIDNITNNQINELINIIMSHNMCVIQNIIDVVSSTNNFDLSLITYLCILIKENNIIIDTISDEKLNIIKKCLKYESKYNDELNIKPIDNVDDDFKNVIKNIKIDDDNLKNRLESFVTRRIL